MIWNVILDMVAMLIALCIICVVFGFVFWALAWVGRLVRRFVADVGSALRDELDSDTIKVMLGILPTTSVTWCQGCDELVSEGHMKFIDGLYRCDRCRGDQIILERFATDAEYRQSVLRSPPPPTWRDDLRRSEDWGNW